VVFCYQFIDRLVCDLLKILLQTFGYLLSQYTWDWPFWAYSYLFCLQHYEKNLEIRFLILDRQIRIRSLRRSGEVVMAALFKNSLKPRTRGEIEAEMTQAIVKFEKEFLGRGPLDARTFFINDMILIRLKGVITPAERKLAESRDGQMLVKETRRQLLETCRPIIEELVQEIIGCKMVSLHTDMSTRTGERILVFTVDRNLDDLD